GDLLQEPPVEGDDELARLGALARAEDQAIEIGGEPDEVKLLHDCRATVPPASSQARDGVRPSDGDAGASAPARPGRAGARHGPRPRRSPPPRRARARTGTSPRSRRRPPCPPTSTSGSRSSAP